MKALINEVLRKHNVIDNGISDHLAQVCGQEIYRAIREEISFAGAAISALQGILSNPDIGCNMLEDETAETAIEYAEALHKKLYKRIDLLETPADPTIQ